MTRHDALRDATFVVVAAASGVGSVINAWAQRRTFRTDAAIGAWRACGIPRQLPAPIQ